MNPSARVVGFSLLAAVTIGAALQFATLLVDEAPAVLIHSVSTRNGVLNLVAIFLFTVIPASVPMALLGGMFAARMLRRQAGVKSMRSWLGRGCAWGACFGAVGSVAWFVVPYLGEQGALQVTLLMGGLGAAAGTLVGGGVGAYCWCLSSRGRGPRAEASAVRPS